VTKIKHDVTNIEDTGGFEPPPIGLYRAEIVEAEDTVSSNGNDMLALVLELRGGKFDGRKIWEYITYSSAMWRLKQLVKACGLREKGGWDTDDVIGQEVMVRLKHEQQDEQFGGGVRARVNAILALPDDTEDLEGSSNGSEAEDESEGDGDDDAIEDYSELSLAELRAECQERGLKSAGPKKVLVQRLEKDDEDAGI
jgi:hypothetical protein